MWVEWSQVCSVLTVVRVVVKVKREWMVLSRFFFFKQKTAYEMLRSLVGSEMCIRDSLPPLHGERDRIDRLQAPEVLRHGFKPEQSVIHVPVSYTHLTLPTIYSV